MVSQWKIGISALVLAGAATSGCAKKKSRSPAPASPAPAATPTATTALTATLDAAVSNAQSSSLLLTDEQKEEMALAATGTTVSCAVPPTAATSTCTVTPDTTTGQVSIPATCLSPSGTVCQVSNNGTVVSNAPVQIDTTTSTITVQLTADTSTGSATVQQVDANGNSVASPTPSVSSTVYNLAIPSGLYSFTFCPGKQTDADANVFPTFTSCTGSYTQANYVNFIAGSATAWPVLEIWRSAAALASCTASGSVVYSLSDGTKTFKPTVDANSNFDALALKSALITNGWVPDGAAARFKYSSPTLAPKKTGGGNQAAQEALRTAYASSSNVCADLATDLKAAWDAATLTYKSGQPTCTGVSANTKATGMNTHFNSDANFLSQCGMYKAKQNGYTMARFVADCQINMAGTPGAQQQAQVNLQLVDNFLRAVSDVRHQGGDSRFVPLANAFALLPADLSTLSATDSSYDTKLIAFLTQWAGLSWDPAITQAAGDVITNFTTTITDAMVTSTKHYLKKYVGQTGRAVLLGWLQDSNKQTQITNFICKSAGNGALQFQAGMEQIRDKASIANLYGDFTSTGAWKSTVTQAQKCTDISAVFTDILANQNLSFCAKALISSAQSNLSPCSDQDTRHYTPVSNAYYSYKVSLVQAMLNDPDADGNSPYSATLNSDGTYGPNTAYTAAMAATDVTALETALNGLANFKQGAWLAGVIKDVDAGKNGADAPAKLYMLTQAALEAISRDAFNTDPNYQTTLQAIQKNSSCPFDAAVDHLPTVDAAGNPTFLANISSPTFRQFHGQIHLSPNATSSNSLYEAVDSMLYSGRDCTFGHRQDINNLAIDSSGNLTFSDTEAFLQCNQGPNAATAVPLVNFLKGVPQSTN